MNPITDKVHPLISRGGSTSGARGIKHPYLAKINGYTPKPPPFLGPKNEEEGGERRREGEKEEEKGDEPPLDLIWLLDSPLLISIIA